MKTFRTTGFVFVPIYVEVAPTRVSKAAVSVSSQSPRSQDRQWILARAGRHGGKSLEGLQGRSRANQSPPDDPPFWTWFVDNPRPSWSRRS